MIMDLTPKYKIGDSVFFRSMEMRKEKQPCPDCLETRKWKVSTPAGDEFEIQCARCASGYFDAPGIHVSSWHPVVRPLTIGSIRIDTAADAERRIEYMCCETGVGSGSIYSEAHLFGNEADALAAAAALCAEKNAEQHQTKVIERDRTLSGYKLSRAYAEAERRVSESLRDELDEIEQKVRDEYTTDEELVEFLREKWPKES